MFAAGLILQISGIDVLKIGILSLSQDRILFNIELTTFWNNAVQ